MNCRASPMRALYLAASVTLNFSRPVAGSQPGVIPLAVSQLLSAVPGRRKSPYHAQSATDAGVYAGFVRAGFPSRELLRPSAPAGFI